MKLKSWTFSLLDTNILEHFAMVTGIEAKFNLKILTDFNFYFRGFEFHPDNESFNQTWILLFLFTQL